MEDHYKVLGVDRNASTAEINKAYKKLVLENHPDRIQAKFRNLNDSDKKKKVDESQEKMQKINAAYDVLKDKNKRQQYDNFGHQEDYNDHYNERYSHYKYSYTPGDSQQFSTFQDFFFGNGDSYTSANKQSNYFYKTSFNFDDNFSDNNDYQNYAGYSKNSEAIISLSLEDWFRGTTKTINYTSKKRCDQCIVKQTCYSCGGKGYNIALIVKITCSTCRGAGKIEKNSGCNKCKNGYIKSENTVEIKLPKFCNDKLYVEQDNESPIILEINLLKHLHYKIKNKNIHTTIKIGIKEFFEGGKYNLKYLDGDSIVINYPPLSLDNIVVRKRGIDNIGDLIIEINIVKNIDNIQEIIQSINKSQTSKIDSHFIKIGPK